MSVADQAARPSAVKIHFERREVRAIAGALGLALPLLIATILLAAFASGAELRVYTLFLISLIAVIGIGTFTGNSGILSFGHVAFMALGAYVSGIFTVPEQMKAIAFSALPEILQNTQLGMFPALLIALVFIAVVAAVIGVSTLR